MSTLPQRRVLVGAGSLLVAATLVACSAGGSGAVPTRPPQSVPATASASPACSQASQLATWSNAALAAQVLAAPVTFNHISTANSLVRAGFGGLILFGPSAPKNLGNQLATLFKQTTGVKPVVMADEEGGSVQRMQSIVGYVPSARYMGQTMNAAQIKQQGLKVGRALVSVHVLMNLAPVLDVDSRPGPNASNPDGTRSFSGNPQRAAVDGVAFANGLTAGGAIATAKHFPGLGGSNGNTDVGKGTTLPWSTLQKSALIPFKAAIAAGVPVIMVANASVPGLTNQPASVSPAVMRTVLRTQLGFKGAIITDSLSAGALRAAGYSLNGAIVASLAAGADILLFGTATTTAPSIALHARDAIVAAVTQGKVPRARLLDAASRVLALKRVNLCVR